ncbi:MAG: MarR family transcriptional regulator, partial [Chitinophagaceae bacterium]
MDFYTKAGKMALGSRLRRLSEKLTDQSAQVYALYNVKLQPKWFPVFYTLCHNESMSITAIAQYIGHSHPSVSTIVKEMIKQGLAAEMTNAEDGRRNMVALTESGKLMAQQMTQQYNDVNAAIEQAM